MRHSNSSAPKSIRSRNLWLLPPVMALLTGLLWAGAVVAAPSSKAVAQRTGGLELLGDGPDMLSFGAGAFNFNQRGPSQNNQISVLGRIELRFGHKFGFIGPAIGVMANTDGGVFGYAGTYADLRYHRFILTPLLAVGAYRQGGSKNLGDVFQFLLTMTLSYVFANQSRLGIRFAHISNGGLHSRNPSEQALMLSYAIPF